MTPVLTAAPGGGRLQQIDGLRGIAMLFVFMGHFATIWTASVHPKGAAGLFLKIVDADATFGSSFFMLLSTFFVYGLLRRGSRSFKSFLCGRLWRIYPLYLVMITVYVAGSILLPRMSKLPANHTQAAIYILEALLFLPGLLPIAPLMEFAWTLSFIILFYFIAGALAFVFRHWPVPRLSRFVLLTSAAVLWALIGDYTHCWQERTAILWVGMALSEAVDYIWNERRAWAKRMVVPAVLIVVLGVWGRTYLMLHQVGTPFVSLQVWVAAISSVTLSAFVWICYFGPQWWKHLLSAPRLRQLGAASYSFYLTHGFALKIFRYGIVPSLGPAAGTPVVFWASQLAGLALSIGIALLVYTLIENPLSRLAPQKSALRRPATFAAQPANITS